MLYLVRKFKKKPIFTLFYFSRAIMCYLVNKYSGDDAEKQKLYPTDPEQVPAYVDNFLSKGNQHKICS